MGQIPVVRSYEHNLFAIGLPLPSPSSSQKSSHPNTTIDTNTFPIHRIIHETRGRWPHLTDYAHDWTYYFPITTCWNPILHHAIIPWSLCHLEPQSRARSGVCPSQRSQSHGPEKAWATQCRCARVGCAFICIIRWIRAQIPITRGAVVVWITR